MKDVHPLAVLPTGIQRTDRDRDRAADETATTMTPTIRGEVQWLESGPSYILGISPNHSIGGEKCKAASAQESAGGCVHARLRNAKSDHRNRDVSSIWLFGRNLASNGSMIGFIPTASTGNCRNRICDVAFDDVSAETSAVISNEILGSAALVQKIVKRRLTLRKFPRTAGSFSRNLLFWPRESTCLFRIR